MSVDFIVGWTQQRELMRVAIPSFLDASLITFSVS